MVIDNCRWGINHHMIHSTFPGSYNIRELVVDSNGGNGICERTKCSAIFGRWCVMSEVTHTL